MTTKELNDALKRVKRLPQQAQKELTAFLCAIERRHRINKLTAEDWDMIDDHISPAYPRGEDAEML